MQQTLFNLGQDPVKSHPVSVLKGKLYKEFILDRFDSPLGYILIILLGFMIAFAIGKGGMDVGLALLAFVIGVPALIGAVFHVRFGVFMTLIASTLVIGIKRYVGDLPLGIFLDASVCAMLFGILIQQGKKRDLGFIKHPLSAFVFTWIGYSLFEGLNPYPHSIIPWIYTVRHIALLMMIYFVGLYVFREAKYIRHLVWIWSGLACLAAIYGLQQELFGLNQIEYDWVMGDPKIFSLFHVADRFRIFSFFSDPTVFGIMMAASALICIPFALSPELSLPKRMGIWTAIVLMLFAIIFSGTRTAYIIFPAGLFFMTFMRPTKKMLALSAFTLVIGICLLTIPTENTQVLRLRTAFSFEGNESLQVRIQNQAYIQPIIQEFPIGNGLGTTGIWGQRFAPERLLSQFPPDSGYVRLGVESGWIGLLLFCTFMAAILWTAARTYFAAKTDLQQRYALAFFGFLFAMILAHYPQQAITQLPNSIMFYLSMAVIVRIGDISWPDPVEQKELN